MKMGHYRNRKNLCHSLLVRLMCILPDQVLEVKSNERIFGAFRATFPFVSIKHMLWAPRDGCNVESR